jgi:hypothetical protein
MKKSLRRIRGALGMGLTWAAGWALAGVLIGVTSRLLPGLPWDSFFEVFDAPLPALAIPGFIGGALFSTVLGIAGRHRRFDELSLPRFAAWGALGGLLLSLVPAAAAAVGFLTVGPGVDLWRATAVMGGPLTLLSALSASGSLMLARRAEGRASLEVSTDAAEAGLADGEAQELLRGSDRSLHDHPTARSRQRLPS